jgi:hypothetical protein
MAEQERDIAANFAASRGYPVRYTVDYPRRMSRRKGVQRSVGALLTWALPAGLGYVSAEFYFALWIIFASLIAFAVIIVPILLGLRLRSKGRERFQAEDGASLERVARRVMAAAAYALFLTDAPPSQAIGGAVRLELTRGRRAGWLRALVTPVLLLPHVILLTVFAFTFTVVVPVSAVAAIGFGRYPRPLFAFTEGYLRWIARALAYWLLLTDRYPPLSFAGG